MATPFHHVSVVDRASPAGEIWLPAIEEHRIAIHLSPQTRSVCRETGYRCVRTRGDVDIVPAGSVGGYSAATPTHAIEVRLTPALVAHVADECGVVAPQVTAQHLVSDPRIRRLAAAFIDGDSEPLYRESLATALAVRLISHATPAANGTHGVRDAKLDRVLAYIDANLDRALTAAELASVARASSAYLRRWFTARTGQSLHRYVVSRRVARARELLDRGELPASEIALATGFAHQSHMARWLRRLHGVTPRSLRRRA